MWFGSGNTKTHVEEANRHLSELSKKVSDLEEKLNQANAELKKKEDDFSTVMYEVHEKRQLEVKQLNTLIYQQNLKVHRMEKDLASRDSELNVLRKRARMLDEVLRYKATLGKLTITLEQAEQYARVTSQSKNGFYPSSTGGDCMNTEPAPLMLRDVPASNVDADSPDMDYEDRTTGGLTRLIHLSNNSH